MKIQFTGISVVFILLLLNFSGFTQNKYAVSLIPDSIKKHADAVIRYSKTDLIIKNSEDAIYKIKKIVTILNKSGESHAYITAPYDKLRKFVSLKGRYYDKAGNLLDVVKKKDIKDISNYEGLYSDNRLKYVEKPALNPPYTVEYEIELQFKGIFYFPDWHPVYAYYLAVEKAVLNITSSPDYQYKTKEINFDKNEISEVTVRNSQNMWTVENMKPVLPEPYNYSILNIVPSVLIAPVNFKLEGYEGKTDTWQDFGEWIYKLNQDRDELPEETILKIQDLIKNLPDDKAKAKAIYEYMQNKTRYVSIQLGIGGWQPFEASVTDANGYGDCKALTYYTKSLLNIAGIKSYYTIIDAGRNASPLVKDFPSPQFNHVILCVPSEKDTVWLECTNQKKPFGYLGDFTDDRNALMITQNGGKLVHTTSYSEEINTQIRAAKIKLSENGDIQAKIHTEYNGLQYDNVSDLFDLSDVNKEKKIKIRISLPGISIENFKYTYTKDEIPSANENLNFNVKSYTSVSSGRLFLKPNLLNQKKYIPKRLKNRKSNIDLRFPYTDIDTLIYELPNNLTAEYIPDTLEYKSEFGYFIAETKVENHNLLYIRKIIMHKGSFPASDYNDLRKFLKFIVSSDKQTCVFKFTE